MATYLACGALLIVQTAPVLAAGSQQHGPPLGVAAAIIFTLLAYLGERATLQVSNAIDLSLATPVHIALILLFPPPYAMLITLVAALASQIGQVRSPLYKRLFNSCHPALVVGLSSALFDLMATPTVALGPGRVASALPVLALLTLCYYVLDVGILLGVLSILERQPPWRIWWQTNRRTMLPELAAVAIGVLAAALWLYDPILLAVLALPAVALRAAFRITAQAEQAQHRAEQAQRMAEEAMRVRDEFLTAASHDLRTPLTSIVGYADLVHMRLAHGAPGDVASLRVQIEALRQSARRMMATVEEINDVAQLEIGQRLTLQMETVSVDDIVQTAIAMVTAATPRGAAAVVVEGAPNVAVYGDRLRLERVMQNIIGNAVKYSPTARPIQVTVEQRKRWIVIAVRDYGVGIPAAELPHIFTRFYRASTASGIRGSGVGLAGAQQIVQQHGGRIEVESVVGEGTTVSVFLPRNSKRNGVGSAATVAS